MRELWRRITFFFSRRRLYEELAEEMQIHQEMKSGQPGFGNPTRWKEISRDVWISPLLDTLIQDLRFGSRQLRRNPGVTATIVISLALGMGATTAIFSLMNALLFKALPVTEPQQLVAMTHGLENGMGPSLSYPLFERLRAWHGAGVELFGYSYSEAQLISGPLKRKVGVQLVSGNFYSVLQVRPAIGRLLEAENDRRGGRLSDAAVISDRLWRGSFHQDAGVIGRKILLDGHPFVVIGVAPRNFFGVEPGSYPDVAITFGGYALLSPKQTLLDCRSCSAMEAMGRLRPGVKVSQAEASLQLAWRSALRDTVPENLPDRYRKEYFADRLVLEPAGSGPDSYLRNRFTKPLYLLLGMSALILLAACSNVANLLLARAHARQRELAIRLSTGASRRRILQQFLTESLLLALLGLVAGAVIYEVCVLGLIRFMQRNGQDVFLATRPDALVLVFIIVLTILTVLLFGLAPAMLASRSPLRSTLAEMAPALASKSKLGSGILAAQVALSLTLITGALLLARSLYDLRTFDAGFRRDHLLIASPDVSETIPKAQDQLQFEQQVVARIRALPGVRAASASTLVPVVGGLWTTDFVADGYVPQTKNDTKCYVNFVSPGFFETMGTPLLLGREFEARDQQPNAPVAAIVNESFARHFWSKENPIGKRVHEVDKAKRIAVIGVARDAKYRTLRDDAPRTIYLRFPPPPAGLAFNFQVEVWTAPHPEALVPAVRKIFQDENAQIPVRLQTFDRLIDGRLLYERLLSGIAICFGVLALLMATVGVYGVAAYSASRRTLEVGIRVALGATKPQILWLFVRQHLAFVLAGLAAGVASALGLAQFLRAWLFGISAADAPSFVAGMGVLAAVSAIAILIPAARAMRLEPWRLLQND
jgi:predicted permease